MDYGQGGNSCCGNNCSHELNGPATTAKPLTQIVPSFMRGILENSMLNQEYAPTLQPVPTKAMVNAAEFKNSLKGPADHEPSFRDPNFGPALANNGLNPDSILTIVKAGGADLAGLKAYLPSYIWDSIEKQVIWKPVTQKVDREGRVPVLNDEAQKFCVEVLNLEPAFVIQLITDGGPKLDILRDFIGANAYNILTSRLRWLPAEPAATEASLTQKGINAMMNARVVKVPAPLSEMIQTVAKASTLAAVVSEHIVPELNKALTDTIKIQDPIKRMREQRRLSDRFQKLMRYVSKPQSISVGSIACEHELAIYKWFQYNQAVHGQITEAAAHDKAAKAHTAFEQRQKAIDTRKGDEAALQEKNQKRAAAMEAIIAEVGAVEQLINGLETGLLAKKFRDLAESLERVENGGEPAVQAQLPFVRGVVLRNSPDNTTPAPQEPSFRASDNSDMGLDYRRSVETTEGGYSDDKFGAATRRGFTTGLNLGVAGAKQGITLSALKPKPTLANPADEFIQSVIGRLKAGEAIAEAELLKAAELSRTPGVLSSLATSLGQAVGERMMGKTPFIQQ